MSRDRRKISGLENEGVGSQEGTAVGPKGTLVVVVICTSWLWQWFHGSVHMPKLNFVQFIVYELCHRKIDLKRENVLSLVFSTCPVSDSTCRTFRRLIPDSQCQ
jgi:hypothetical protein